MLENNIRNLRKERNMSQDELAEKLGVSRQSISLWETGQTQPSLENVLSLASIFHVSTDALLGNDLGNDPAKELAQPQPPASQGQGEKQKAWLIAGVGILTVALVVIGTVLFWQMTPNGVSAGADMEPDSSALAVSQLLQYFNTRPDKSVICPDLIGQNYEEAIRKKSSIKIVINDWQHSKEYSYGQIIEQSPAKDKVLKEGATVTVTVSSGNGSVLMPDLQSYTLEAAKAKLAEKQYAKVYREDKLVVAEEYHNSVAKGEIIRTEPAGNAEMNPDSPIKLYVSRGPEPNMVSMPPIVGKSQSAAAKKLEQAGLHVKVIESDSTIAKGIVLSARCNGVIVNENDKLVYGSTVEITVSTGNPAAEVMAYGTAVRFLG